MKFTLASILSVASVVLLSLSYGKYGAFNQFGSLDPIDQSAQELATFAEDVMARLKVSQVDLVGKFKCWKTSNGHSQGGSIGRYWVKYLGRRGKVNTMISVSPINHGTTLSNIVTIAKAFGVLTSVDTSSFIANLNKGGYVAPGVIISNIATKYDEMVTPFKSCYSEKAGVTNQLLQALCMVSLNEHLTMVNSKVQGGSAMGHESA
ncbi:hypothetical protein BG000_006602 [Podila horticola]|nr:hypothetical protein BG000_006602 [Podila horticola]